LTAAESRAPTGTPHFGPRSIAFAIVGLAGTAVAGPFVLAPPRRLALSPGL